MEGKMKVGAEDPNSGSQRHVCHLYYKNLRFPRTIPGFERDSSGGWRPWAAGVGCGSRVSRLVSACRSRFGRGAVVEGATTTVTFGGEGAVRVHRDSSASTSESDTLKAADFPRNCF